MGSKETDLEWKDFFGSSVSLAPSLISMYDKKIKEGVISECNDIPVSEHGDPRKRPFSIRSNDSCSSNSSASKPLKKKAATSWKRPMCREMSTDTGESSMTSDSNQVIKMGDLNRKKFENRRSKSVENGMRLKKGESFNSFLVCREILETEKIYVRDLKETIEGYKRAMESKSRLFSSEDVQVLFGNIEDIYSFHCKLLKELVLHERDVNLLSDSFIKNASNFKMYSHYCTNYPRSQKVVMMMMGDEDASFWLQEKQAILGHKLPLSSYLLKPVQRILKYHLLFQNLLKSFEVSDDTESTEFIKVSAALNCMSSVAKYINEMKRIHDKNLKMKEILDLLVTCNSTINLGSLGELIIEDKFQFGVKTLQHILLFEKQILICKWKENCSLLIKVQIPCSNLMLVETISKSPLSFSIHPFTDPTLLFTIQAKSLEQKSLWCHEIRKAILENFGSFIPDKAWNIVMNLTPEIVASNQTDEKGLGQIEWRKSSRRCSMAIVPDIRQPTKSFEMCNSMDNYSCLEDKQKHLPLSQSLFSVIDEPLHNPSVSFCTSSSTLTRGQRGWSHDQNISAYRSLMTLDRGYAKKVALHDLALREERAVLPLFKRNSSADDSLLSRNDDDNYGENLSEGSGETSQGSNSSTGNSQPMPNIPKRTESLHNSSVHSASSKSSFRSTFINLRDKFKKRSHSTGNRHYRSTPKLQGALEDKAEFTRRGPSHRLVSRFTLSGKKYKSSQSEACKPSPPDNSGHNQTSPSLRAVNGVKTSPCPAYQRRAYTLSGGDRKCFSPATASKILYIDDSDDG